MVRGHVSGQRWVHGQSLSDLPPAIAALVPKRLLNSRSVHDALADQQWIADVRRNLLNNLSGQVVLEFFNLVDVLDGFQLSPRILDQHIWTPSAIGVYSSKSAYDRFLVGTVEFEPAHRIWKSWAPPKCKFFIWLITLSRCWTADQLARRGMDHPEQCPLCDQEEETIQHLLTSCVFTREVWFTVLSWSGRQHLCPTPDDLVFQDWWRQSLDRIPQELRKGFSSLVILVAWWVWKHRNACVFDGAAPNIQ